MAKPDLVFVRSLRARHYRLTLRKDGVAVATVPARGSEQAARLFVEQHGDWLARARARHARRPQAAEVWTIGTVGQSGAFMGVRVVNNDLGNIPSRVFNIQAGQTPNIARPSTFFYQNPDEHK